ncbi:hypothetical protein P692DRAFT_20844226 [Suillus brevipes Sb2]|nr:hypothetical protein P692DRAFT_20844226 [Suillus brevipes Sb2]
MDEDLPEGETYHKCKRAAGDHPLLNWIKHQELFLLEMLRHDGRGNNLPSDLCSSCGMNIGVHRCKDCFSSQLLYQGCVVDVHARLPLHCVENWNGTYFQNVTLKDLGLRIQLGHNIGESCQLPVRAFNNDFVLINTHAIHPIAIDFCSCTKAQSHIQQLLRVGWFPATTSDPKTAATFAVLQHFHILSFDSKVSAYEFYHTLVRLTDNTGLLKRKDQYKVFMHMVREFQHLKMLKQAARGHDPSGIIATQQGKCAVLCPACPHSGKNIPDDWALASKARVYVLASFTLPTSDTCLDGGIPNFLTKSVSGAAILA